MSLLNSDILWSSVPDEWPLRLLHVPTMTSLVRGEGNTYGSVKEPSYSVLTYTWGRFEIESGPRLTVAGIKWPIPAIKEDHFSVAQFEQVLKSMSSKHEYVWVDVACINQGKAKEEKEEKMHQVGRQAAIFRNAREAYIWLNQIEPEQLTGCLHMFLKASYELARKEISVATALDSMIRSLKVLFKDPWFSSLWTLQESVLKRTASILDRNGDLVVCQGPWAGEDARVSLLDICGSCELIRVLLDVSILAAPECDEHGQASDLRKIVDEAGIGFSISTNPNVQYSSARHRQTKHPEDRIYAIMQVYGFQLGQSAERDKTFTLAELELQFLQALGKNCVVSQAFSHQRPPAAGQSWAITPFITIPRSLFMIIQHEALLESSSCTITVHNRERASFAGRVCSLESLAMWWAEDAKAILEGISNGDVNTKWGSTTGSESYWAARRKEIILDVNPGVLGEALSGQSRTWPPYKGDMDDNGNLIVETLPRPLSEAMKTMQDMIKALESLFGSRIVVLYLGSWRYDISKNCVLLLVKRGSMFRVKWVRVGLCVWSESFIGMEHSPTWRTLSADFG